MAAASGVAQLPRQPLVGVARPFSTVASGRVECAAVVLLPSLAFLHAAQRRLHLWQLLLCLGSPDRVADPAATADLLLHLVHVDANRAEEVANTVMAFFLGLLRRTLLLLRHASSAPAAVVESAPAEGLRGGVGRVRCGRKKRKG